MTPGSAPESGPLQASFRRSAWNWNCGSSSDCWWPPSSAESWATNSLTRIRNSSSTQISRSEEHTSELQSHRDLHSFPTRRSSDLFIVKMLFFCQYDPRVGPRVGTAPGLIQEICVELELRILVRLLVAAIVGGIVGYEQSDEDPQFQFHADLKIGRAHV